MGVNGGEWGVKVVKGSEGEWWEWVVVGEGSGEYKGVKCEGWKRKGKGKGINW